MVCDQFFLRGSRALTSITLPGSVLTPTQYNDTSVLDGLAANATTVLSDAAHAASTEPEYTWWQNVLAYSAGVLFVVGIMWCSRSNVPGPEHIRAAQLRRQRWNERRRRRLRRDRWRVDQNPEKRQILLDQALATADIQSYDVDSQQLTLGRSKKDGAADATTETATSSAMPQQPIEETENTSTCVICLDVFEVGDKVAWNRRAMLNLEDQDLVQEKEENSTEEAAWRCRHVFHYDCIREWLGRHEDCPSCRLAILELPEDDDDDEDDDELGSDVERASSSGDTSVITSPDPEENDDEAVGRDDWGSTSRHSTTSVGDSSMLVIVRGLVSRVKRASRSLVGGNNNNNNSDLAAAAAATSILPTTSPLRRVLSTGRAHFMQKQQEQQNGHRSRASVSYSRKKVKQSPPARRYREKGDIGFFAATDGVQLRRVKSIGPGSPVRTPQRHPEYYADDIDYTDDDEEPQPPPHPINSASLAPYPIPPAQTFGVPFRRTSSTGNSSIGRSALTNGALPSSVAFPPDQDESLTEDYEDDLLIPTISWKDTLLSTGYGEQDDDDDDDDEAETSDDHTVPSSTQRRPPRFIPFRRVVSTGGAYAAIIHASNSGNGNDDDADVAVVVDNNADRWITRQTPSGDGSASQKSLLKRPSVSWRDSRLAVSQSQDEDDFLDDDADGGGSSADEEDNLLSSIP